MRGEHCDVLVSRQEDDGPAPENELWIDTDVRTDDEDAYGNAIKASVAILAANGWTVTGEWEYTGDAIEATVEHA